MKRLLSVIITFILISGLTFGSFAEFKDIPQNAPYEAALNRLISLNIMDEPADGLFKPDSPITRVDFSKAMILASNLKEYAQSLEGISIFDDIQPGEETTGYINAAVNKGFITPKADGLFHPQDGITFAQACTIMVRALGYGDQDVPGTWPLNYIGKASDLGLIKGINQKSGDKLSRWAAIVMLDRLLDTAVKGFDSGNMGKTYAEASGLYMECIVLGDWNTIPGLVNLQVLTDKGAFYTADTVAKLEPGNKYRLAVRDDTITRVYAKLNSTLGITIDNIFDSTVLYRDGGRSRTMVLPEKTVYYYNGQRQDYQELKNIIKQNTSLVFAYNDGKAGYEYALVFDPVYSKPQLAVNFDPDKSKKIGSIEFKNNTPALLNGEIIRPHDIKDGDIVYSVSDIWGKNIYLLIVRNNVQGKITGILPNKLSPRIIQIDGKDYELGKDMKFNKINNSSNAYKTGDNVVICIGWDGKVVDVLSYLSNSDSGYAFVLNYINTISMEQKDFGREIYQVKLLLSDGSTQIYKTNTDSSQYKGKIVKYRRLNSETVNLEQPSVIDPRVKKLFDDISGLYSEIIVTGDSSTSDRIPENQVMTDKGLMYVNDRGIKLELGNKYKVVLDGDSIVKVDSKLTSVKSISVSTALDTYVKYKEGGNTKEMFLPEKTEYYYRGTKLDYAELKNRLEVNTSIIFAYNPDKTAFTYALIIDPVHSKPEIKLDYDTVKNRVGNIDLTGNPVILKDGRIIKASDIIFGDTVYEVTDLWQKNRYIEVVRNHVSGIIIKILPNKLSPKSIVIEGQTYEFSRYMDFSRINTSEGAFKENDRVIAVLGYDGKVIALLSP